MVSDLKPISYIRQVIYTTYANFPAGGLKPGDLAYATDRLVLYRWSGTAWQATTIYSSSGTAGAIPAAADLPNGSLYYETDTTILKQVQAGAWAVILAALVIAETSVYNANPPAAWTDLDLSAVVGSQKALVVLKIDPVSGGWYKFRPNGDTEDYTAGVSSTNGVSIGNTQAALIIVYTDAAGIVEWISNIGANNAEVFIEAWQAA